MDFWSLGKCTGLELEAPYLVSSIRSQFLSFFHWIVLDLRLFFLLLCDLEDDL